MYGFVNFAVEELVLRNFGEETWNKIKKEAGVEIEGHFMIRVIYNDEDTYALVMAASRVLNLPASAILELFGQFFFEFCVESGYDKILSVLGSTTKDFLENLDALHDHLSTIYPGMKAPSFRCTEGEDGSLILHYYSDRPGLEFIVIGLVKTVASKLHKSQVECKVLKDKGEDGCDHVQFQIIETSSENKERIVEDKSGLRHTYEKFFSNKQMMGPKTFCNAFPFHIIFDKHMVIRQCGTSIARVIPQMKDKNCKLTDIFTIIRPHIQLDFQSICSQIMSVFVLSTKSGILDLNKSASTGSPSSQETKRPALVSQMSKTTEQIEKDTCTRFKGQMVFLRDKELILFQCSPSVMSLEDLYLRGLCISDIPLHDANRDLMLMNEHWEEEWNLTQSLEILNDKLQKALSELESEKKKTDNLLYSVLPPSIAQQLRHNKPVLPARYDHVTLMFCGIKDFGTLCAKFANDSQQIVNVLNLVFTKFDEKVNKYQEIYKVETVGDKYMAVCGLPEKVEAHTKYMAHLALDIMDATSELEPIEGEKIVTTCGINCGEIVTGVIGKRMPRYCLFGDTVNLTSRCESTGIKGKINVSDSAYENLQKPENQDPEFQFEYRGEVPMKGKPKPIRMWILSRRKKEGELKLKDGKTISLEQVKCPFSQLATKN